MPVAPDVELEVLDWGGTGRPVLLLAGFGNTAHVFDNFAPRLRALGCRVLGVTRRGFGMSSHPESGYALQRLSADVLAVLDGLRIESAILIGHSIAGLEMSLLAAQHPGRIGGVVYLDAADPNFLERLREPGARGRLPELPFPSPAARDRNGFRELQDWWRRQCGILLPEAELRNSYQEEPAGRVGAWRGAPNVWEELSASQFDADVHSFRAPVLALFAVPRTAADVEPWVRPYLQNHRDTLETSYEFARKERELVQGQFFSARPNRQVVELPGANHYVFLSHPDDVLREIRRFLARLR